MGFGRFWREIVDFPPGTAQISLTIGLGIRPESGLWPDLTPREAGYIRRTGRGFSYINPLYPGPDGPDCCPGMLSGSARKTHIVVAYGHYDH